MVISTPLNRSIPLPEPSHAAVVWFVYVWYFLVYGFAVDHLHRRFAEQSLFVFDQLFEETGVWPDLGSGGTKKRHVQKPTS